MGTRSHPEIRGARPAYRIRRSVPGFSADVLLHTSLESSRSPPPGPARDAAASSLAQNQAMTARSRRLRRSPLLLAAITVLLLTLPPNGASGASSPDAELPSWRWPLAGVHQVVEPFRAPAHAYGRGHRGVDIAAAGGAEVLSPADGVVAFRGTVVDRPLLTIDHGDGLVSTFEPLESSLSPGDAVVAGDPIGVVGGGGHTPSGALHVGVRRHGVYINPMLLFGEVRRAVLLPCCAPL